MCENTKSCSEEPISEVFLVGIADAEGNCVVSVHKSYQGAFKSWNRSREKLIKDYKRIKFMEVSRGLIHEFDSSENKAIENLYNENPETINNYPNETPYITKFKLEE